MCIRILVYTFFINDYWHTVCAQNLPKNTIVGKSQRKHFGNN